jgi:hypothetical protein
MTMTTTYTTTFTLTHARHLASKVIADLYLCSRQYGRPSGGSVLAYQEELTALLAGRYVEAYEFGFKRNEKRVLSWHYTVGPAGDLQGDSRSGGLVRGIDVADAMYFNFLTHNDRWSQLSAAEQKAIEDTLPIERTWGSAPGDGNGYWATERTYTAGGTVVVRRVFRPW